MNDLFFLLKLAEVRKRDVLTAIIAGSLTLISALALTIVSGWLITRAWEMPPVLHLTVATVSVRALGISRAVFRYIDRLVSHKVALRAQTVLRGHVFDAVSSRKEVLSRGEGHTRLVTDTERVTDLIVRTLVPVGVATVVSVAALVFTAILSLVAAVVMALAFVVTGWAIPALALRANKAAQNIDAEDDFQEKLDSVLLHRVEFEAAGKSEQLHTEVLEASAQASQQTVLSARPLVYSDAITAWATGVAALLVTLIAAYGYQGNPVWLGMLVMIPLAAFEAHGPLADAATHAAEVRAPAARLRTLVESPQAPHVERISTTAVHADNLHTLYGDTVWDFSLAPGERMIVRGPSGSGKTTMLRTVAGLLAPANGSVTQPEGARFFAEDSWIFSTTVRENIRVAAPHATDEEMEDVLKALDFDFGLDEMLPDGANSLSSGQARRLLLARALCSTAPVLLIDEPTAHLSRDSAEVVLNTLLHEALPGPLPDRTVILVSHVEGPVGIEIHSTNTKS